MPGKVTVVNKRSHVGPAVYIGRPSIFGNPFDLSAGRRKCIEAYKEWFDDHMKSDTQLKSSVHLLVDYVKSGADINLACYCAPLACHGDVIKAYIDNEINPKHEEI